MAADTQWVIASELAARGTAALAAAMSPMTSALNRAETQRLTILLEGLLREVTPHLS